MLPQRRRRRKPVLNRSDEIVLTWSAPNQKKLKVVKYEIEMFDLGLQVIL